MVLKFFLLLCLTTLVCAADYPTVDALPPSKTAPDPLVMFDGTKVTSKEQWQQKRRPELRALFAHYMYGELPAKAAVKGRVIHEDTAAFGGKGILREVELTFDLPNSPRVYLLLALPKSEKPVAAFLGLNFTGNHTLTKDPKVRIPTAWMYPKGKGAVGNKASEADIGTAIDTWSLETVISRGYGVATMYVGELEADRADVREGAFPRPTKPASGSEGATIVRWVWGLLRTLDYLETVREIDAKRVAVVGHSRLGKTALLAAAMDDRLAMSIPHQAGCGGTAPSRGTVGESVQRINTVFPHWFDDNFKTFNTKTDRLPFDQNCLAALVAPRPILFTNAEKDTWANPVGQFETLLGAEGVYRFLGVEGLASKALPKTGEPMLSRMGYAVRTGDHSMTPDDWKIFLDFADKWLK